MIYEGPERRRSMRIKTTLTVQYAQDALDENTRKWDTTIVRDISEHGICITTTGCFSPKEALTLLIKLPSNPLEHIEMKGRVVDSKSLKASFGQTVRDTYVTRIEFTDLKEEHRELIRSYVQLLSHK